MDLRLDRAERQRQLDGDLLVGVFVEEAHADQPAVVLGQPGDAKFDLVALLRVDDALFGRGGVRGGRRKFLVDRQVVLPLAHVVDEGVAGDGVEPLPKGVFGAVTVEIHVDLDEGLLQQVVGIFGIPRALQEEAVDGVAVAVEEVFERRRVAAEHQSGQLPVVGNDIVGYLHTRSSRRRQSSATSIS